MGLLARLPRRRRLVAGLAALVPALAAAASVAIAASSRATGARASTATPLAFVRVDQLGYAAVGAKRAYLMSTVPESGAAFSVRPVASGAPGFSGDVGRSLGSWSKRFPYVYALDFDSVSAAGDYVLAVAGASSPPFAIGAPATLVGGALRHALTFYEDERDGPGFIRSALRTAPGHLQDGHARTYLTPRVDQNGGFTGDLSPLGRSIDAAGGWWDAGDYLKFVQTTSYTAALILAGVRDFPSQMGASAGRSNFTREARFGVQWLLRMWNDRDRTLYYQVGIGDGNSRTISDHDLWRLPQADDDYGGRNPLYRYIRHRPVFRAGPSGSLVSPNLAGRDAAAFALCFQVFQHTDPRLAARCLRAAEHIFALADTHPHGHLLTAIPWDFYPETEWRDDLELGAVELADALADAGRRARAVSYVRQAAHWARALIAQPGRTIDTLNVYDVSGLADFELYRTIGRLDGVPGLAIGRPGLLADVGRQLHAASAIAARDPFGFGFPWDVEDTASHGFGLAVMASEYANMTGDPAWQNRSRRWLANLLGANAWGASLVIGDGTTFPDCPQHQVANLAGSLNGSGPVLAGAVVEGPSGAAATGLVSHMRRCPSGGDRFALFNNRSAVFRDNVQSYSTVEPAIDLTASSPLAFAWQIASARPLRAGTEAATG